MSDFWSEELITDYLDDRLGPAEREQVEMHLKSNPDDARQLQEFRQMGNALRQAPTFQLGSGFKDRVLNSLPIQDRPVTDQTNANHSSAEETPPIAPAGSQPPNIPPGKLNWKTISIAGVAASILLALFLFPPTMTPDGIAAVDKSESSSADSSSGKLAKSTDSDEAKNEEDGPAESDLPGDVESLNDSGAAPMVLPSAPPKKKEGFRPGRSEGDRQPEQTEKSDQTGLEPEATTRQSQAGDAARPSETMESVPNSEAMKFKAPVVEKQAGRNMTRNRKAPSPGAPIPANVSLGEVFVVQARLTPLNMETFSELESGVVWAEKDDDETPLPGSGVLLKERSNLDAEASETQDEGVVASDDQAIQGDVTIRYEPLQQPESSRVFEVLATPEEFQAILNRIDGQTIALDDDNKRLVQQRVSDLTTLETTSTLTQTPDVQGGLGGGGGGGSGGGRGNADTRLDVVQGPTSRRIEIQETDQVEPADLTQQPDTNAIEDGVNVMDVQEESVQQQQLIQPPNNQPPSQSAVGGREAGDDKDGQVAPVRKRYLLVIEISEEIERTKNPSVKPDVGDGK